MALVSYQLPQLLFTVPSSELTLINHFEVLHIRLATNSWHDCYRAPKVILMKSESANSELLRATMCVNHLLCCNNET